MNDACPYCYQKLPPNLAETKRLKKIANALASRKKALANGSKIGRPKARDDEKIKALRAKGLSIRKIAAEIGFSTTAVQRGIKS